jgi:hypothetical protein
MQLKPTISVRAHGRATIHVGHGQLLAPAFWINQMQPFILDP